MSSDIVSDGIGTLTKPERKWAQRYQHLKDKGYVLRPRYRPGWIPSWQNDGMWYMAEDGIQMFHSHLDATRASDGRPVFLKLAKRPEVELTTLLSAEDKDPRNRCIPVLDVVEDNVEPEHFILVLPILRYVESPQFVSVREAMDFMSQTIDGLVYLHEQGVAHRDCYKDNIMMDARVLYPEGWHPQSPGRHPDGRVIQYRPSRTQVGGVRYYFVDFGISTRNQDTVVGITGQQHAPELSEDIPYDPYKVDVYLLGLTYLHLLVQHCSNLQFLMPLIRKMLDKNPSSRITSSEAQKNINELQAGLTEHKLSERLHWSHQSEFAFMSYIRDAAYRVKEGRWRRQPPLPAPGPFP